MFFSRCVLLFSWWWWNSVDKLCIDLSTVTLQELNLTSMWCGFGSWKHRVLIFDHSSSWLYWFKSLDMLYAGCLFTFVLSCSSMFTLSSYKPLFAAASHLTKALLAISAHVFPLLSSSLLLPCIIYSFQSHAAATPLFSVECSGPEQGVLYNTSVLNYIWFQMPLVSVLVHTPWKCSFPIYLTSLHPF
jgi:hypothetical protein